MLSGFCAVAAPLGIGGKDPCATPLAGIPGAGGVPGVPADGNVPGPPSVGPVARGVTGAFGASGEPSTFKPWSFISFVMLAALPGFLEIMPLASAPISARFTSSGFGAAGGGPSGACEIRGAFPAAEAVGFGSAVAPPCTFSSGLIDGALPVAAAEGSAGMPGCAVPLSPASGLIGGGPAVADVGGLGGLAAVAPSPVKGCGGPRGDARGDGWSKMPATASGADMPAGMPKCA